jgi:carbonic anhydrase/acetyltransferase-like protein (isoleucine patch superfamily)
MRRILTKAGHIVRAATGSSGSPTTPSLSLSTSSLPRINIADQYYDPYCKHRMRINLPGNSIGTPLVPGLKTKVSWESFVAPSATLAGNVELWDKASIWYGCVVRADVNLIRIGAYTNVQDNTSILEALKPLSPDHDGSTIIGHNVTIGHSCRLQGCTVEDECLIGMGAVLHEESYMEKHSMLGAGAVLLRGTRVPSGELWVGNPAKFLRMLTHDEVDGMEKSAHHYYLLACRHKEEFYLPVGTQYIEAEREGYAIGWKGWRYMQ